MKQVKGIVTRISNDKCIILTPEGDFHRVPLPTGPIRVGQQISGKVSTGFTGLSRYATLAACLLLVLVGLFSLQQPASAGTAAYVSLDINPSLELAVDADCKVIGIKALNQDAKRLLQGIEYQKRDVYQVLSNLLQRAVELQYVSREKTNLVVSGVVELSPKVHLDTSRLQKAVAEPLKARNLKVSVLFFKADKAEHDQADNLQLSTGKYIFFKEDEHSDSQKTLDYYKANSLTSMADDHKLKIPGKRMKMVISDTTDWEEQPTKPTSSTPVSQNNKWVNEDDNKGANKQDSNPRKKAKADDSGQTNVREKEQSKSQGQTIDEGKGKEIDKKIGKETEKAKETDKHKENYKGSNKEKANGEGNDSKGNDSKGNGEHNSSDKP